MTNSRKFPTINLAGIAINRDAAEELARQVDDPTASKLARAVENDTHGSSPSTPDGNRRHRSRSDRNVRTPLGLRPAVHPRVRAME